MAYESQAQSAKEHFGEALAQPGERQRRNRAFMPLSPLRFVTEMYRHIHIALPRGAKFVRIFHGRVSS